jgi:hypothetical protein
VYARKQRKPPRWRNSQRDGAYSFECIESNRFARTERILGTPNLQARQPLPTMQHHGARKGTDGARELRIVSPTAQPRCLHQTISAGTPWQGCSKG